MTRTNREMVQIFSSISHSIRFDLIPSPVSCFNYFICIEQGSWYYICHRFDLLQSNIWSAQKRVQIWSWGQWPLSEGGRERKRSQNQKKLLWIHWFIMERKAQILPLNLWVRCVSLREFRKKSGWKKLFEFLWERERGLGYGTCFFLTIPSEDSTCIGVIECPIVHTPFGSIYQKSGKGFGYLMPSPMVLNSEYVPNGPEWWWDGDHIPNDYILLKVTT